MTWDRAFESAFHPKVVAMVGISAKAKLGSPGGSQFYNTYLKLGFPGKIYLVNSNATEILGQKAYPSVSAIPEPVDLVLLLSAKTPQALTELAAWCRHRNITMLVTPLVSCSARLQVYIVIAGTFFTPFKAALAIIAMHFLGLGLAVLMGRVLRSALFSGPSSPFVMELPPYRMPMLKATLIHMWEKGSIFLTRAGTTIFAGATLVWFLSRYPGIANRQWTLDYQQQRQVVTALNLPAAESEERLKLLQLAHESRIVNTSLAARLGQKVEPILRPILDPDHKRAEAWKDVIALTAGFVAKEIVVSTMAVIHQASEEPKEGERLSPLQVSLRDGSGLTPLTALAFMVFTLIYTPCLGTIAMIRREAGSWGWAAFTVGYGLVLGWGLAWMTVAVGRAIGFA